MTLLAHVLIFNKYLSYTISRSTISMQNSPASSVIIDFAKPLEQMDVIEEESSDDAPTTPPVHTFVVKLEETEKWEKTDYHKKMIHDMSNGEKEDFLNCYNDIWLLREEIETLRNDFEEWILLKTGAESKTLLKAGDLTSVDIFNLKDFDEIPSIIQVTGKMDNLSDLNMDSIDDEKDGASQKFIRYIMYCMQNRATFQKELEYFIPPSGTKSGSGQGP